MVKTRCVSSIGCATAGRSQPDAGAEGLAVDYGRAVQAVAQRVGQGIGRGQSQWGAVGMRVWMNSRLKAQSGRGGMATAVTLGGGTIAVAMRAGIRLSCGGCLHRLGVTGMAGHLRGHRRCGISAGNHHGYTGCVCQQGGDHQQQRKQQAGACPAVVSAICCWCDCHVCADRSSSVNYRPIREPKDFIPWVPWHCRYGRRRS